MQSGLKPKSLWLQFPQGTILSPDNFSDTKIHSANFGEILKFWCTLEQSAKQTFMLCYLSCEGVGINKISNVNKLNKSTMKVSPVRCFNKSKFLLQESNGMLGNWKKGIKVVPKNMNGRVKLSCKDAHELDWQALEGDVLFFFLRGMESYWKVFM